MAMERRRGQGTGSGNPKGLTLTDVPKLTTPTDYKGLLALVSSCRLGCNFSGTSSQGFPVTQPWGVFPAKKNVSDQRTRSQSDYDELQRMTKFLFFGIFFLFFLEIREKIKEKIEKDNKE
jgi:hypothetical protein